MSKISIIKKSLQKFLEEGNIEDLDKLIIESEHILKNSIDYFIFKNYVYYFNQEYYKAINLLEKAYILNPYNLDVNYNLLINNLATRNFEKASEYYFNLLKINLKENMQNYEFIQDITDSIINLFYDLHINKNEEIEIIKNMKKKIDKFGDFIKSFNYKNFPNKSVIKEELYINQIIEQKNRKYFTSVYDDGKLLLYGLNHSSLENFRLNNCFEIFEINCIDKKYNLNLKNEYILPILFMEGMDNINIICNEKEYNLKNMFIYRYNYYKLKGEISINCDGDIAIGKPIKLSKNNNNKDLVLTIFIDGLSNSVLKNKGLEILMPNTYSFFKKGLICNQSYATGEWTLPSVASICTGVYTNKHYLYHPSRNDSIPDNIETIFEIYEKNGYNTCFINNDWRITPLYGYLKGVNRYIYEPNIYVNDSSIINEAVTHLETFKNSNQYMFLSFMELHTIGEGELMDIYTQSQMSLEEHSNYIQDNNKSVNQEFSLGKCSAYEYKMKKLDTLLSSLYNYLENNFDLDKCVISLISDHGQSFLERDKTMELNSYRVEVPLMIRSNNFNSVVSNDIIQTTDYLSIMSNICNLSMNLKYTDSILPKFLGGKGREYSYCESIYPNKTYKASINTIDYIGYFESKDVINEEAMVSLEEYDLCIYDKNKNTYIDDENFKNYCLNIVYEHMKYNRIY